MPARFAAVRDHDASPAFHLKVDRFHQAAADRRAVSGDVVHVSSVETVRAMIPNLCTAPRGPAPTMDARKFFITMNRILSHPCRLRPIEQRSHQPLSVHFLGMLDAPRFCKVQCRITHRLIPVDLAPERFDLSPRTDLVQCFLQQLRVHVR